MATRRTFIYLALLGFLCLTLTGQAQQIKGGEFIEARRDSAQTGFIRTTTMNLDTLELFAAAQRIIDSLIAARAGTPQRGEQIVRLHANFSNGANDSVNLAINVSGVYQAYALPYNMYLDRFILHTDQPNGRNASTFRTDVLPAPTTDSTLIFRLSRNASFSAGVKCALTVYKVPLTGGLSFANTAGDFYDMVRFDEAVFPAAGTSAQTVIHLTLKKNQ